MPDPDFQLYTRHRDPEAFRRLVRRHINAVHSAAERVLGHRSALAEDVVQTVFVLLRAGRRRCRRRFRWAHGCTVRPCAGLSMS